jgi:EAL domain-containing protein (putative c-di-GMP-specific phosphodiesterase class I)
MGCEHLQGYLFGRPVDRVTFLDNFSGTSR